MANLTNQEIAKVVYRYIGSTGGYLGDFSRPTHAQFYPLYCDLDIDPYGYSGTTRERFIEILSRQSQSDQAKILRGVLQRFPVNADNAPQTRTKALEQEIQTIIVRLEQQAPIANLAPKITSAVVDQAIADAENLIRTSGPASAIDRIHTAIHGYLREACVQENISFVKNDGIARLLQLLRQSHPGLQALGSRSQEMEKILDSLVTILEALNTLRNQASLAHPNPTLAQEEDAMLAINSSRTLLHYLDKKL